MTDTPVSDGEPRGRDPRLQQHRRALRLEVDHVTATDYQKTGIVLEGAGLTVNVHDCTTTGKGYTAEGPGAERHPGEPRRDRDGHALQGDRPRLHQPRTTQSSGVLVYDTPGPVTVSDCKGANKFSNVQVPVYVYNASGIVDGIEVAGGADTIAICAVNANASACSASARATRRRRHGALQPSPFGDGASGGRPAARRRPARWRPRTR